MRAFAIAVVLVSGVAHADEEVLEVEPPPPPTPFDQGKMNLSIGGGSTSNFDRRYFAIGGGFGYFVLDGLELGIAAVHQFGDGPSISQIQPRVRYVVQPLVGRFPLIPYVGAFYNHWFIGDGYTDVDGIGGRVGLIYLSGRLLLGLGVAVERTVSECAEDCTAVYPDFSISLSF
ncbi:MAG: hypothetical protein M4D80_31120 [Myxococcota bacterium]|nr:hypothetical protein [Deltaproteobacteria bacterium]MDQ3339640.1 hypothetical protein [Myxococcota bacterium]